MIDGENDFAAFERSAAGDETAPAADVPEKVEEEDGGGVGADEPGEAAAADADDGGAGDPEPGDEPEPKRKQTAQERIDEVTRARREAERLARDNAAEAKYWRDVAEGRIKPEAPANDDGPKAPNPDDYDMGDTDPAYIKAFIAFEVKKGVDEGRQIVAQDLHLQAEERAWEAKLDTARSKFADFDQVTQTHDPETGAAKWACTREMAQAIRTSDAAGELTYHLASNPEEARRIAALDPFSQVRELGRLEARLDAPATDTPTPAKTTNAPKPAEALARGAGGKFEATAATTDFAQFEALANRKG